MAQIDTVALKYISLANSLSMHRPEYIDSYFGPKQQEGQLLVSRKLDMDDLIKESEAQLQVLHELVDVDPDRKKYLIEQLTAIRTTAHIEQGQKLSVKEKVRQIYGIQSSRVSEAHFDEAHRLLDESIPGKGTLSEKRQAFIRSMQVPVDRLESICGVVLSEFRNLTKLHFPMPIEEGVDLSFVQDEPFSAYCQYQGDYRSRLQLNIDTPIHLLHLTDLMAHEVYPGHHTEFSFKEKLLVEEGGRSEMRVAVTLSPQLFLSEMIAEHARWAILPERDFMGWIDEFLLPQSGLELPEGADPAGYERAVKMLNPVWTNAVFMHWDEGIGEDQLIDYFMTYALRTHEEANQAAKWVMHPVFHVYTFTYGAGYDLLREVLSRSKEPREVFARLLTQQVVPSTVLSR